MKLFLFEAGTFDRDLMHPMFDVEEDPGRPVAVYRSRSRLETRFEMLETVHPISTRYQDFAYDRAQTLCHSLPYLSRYVLAIEVY